MNVYISVYSGTNFLHKRDWEKISRIDKSKQFFMPKEHLDWQGAGIMFMKSRILVVLKRKY